LGSLGYAYAVANRRPEALEIVERLKAASKERYVPPAAVALTLSGLGDKDGALAWLEKADEERDPWTSGLKVEPMFDSLRPDPRFQDLVRRAGFPRWRGQANSGQPDHANALLVSMRVPNGFEMRCSRVRMSLPTPARPGAASRSR
jgi:hypothetical protein